ncbi:unnamed protein product [Sympodiomycopsis kandeliae]
MVVGYQQPFEPQPLQTTYFLLLIPSRCDVYRSRSELPIPRSREPSPARLHTRSPPPNVASRGSALF